LLRPMEFAHVFGPRSAHFVAEVHSEGPDEPDHQGRQDVDVGPDRSSSQNSNAVALDVVSEPSP
jgi:hypothetical protein